MKLGFVIVAKKIFSVLPPRCSSAAVYYIEAILGSNQQIR
jgi:hypothetical protein